MKTKGLWITASCFHSCSTQQHRQRWVCIHTNGADGLDCTSWLTLASIRYLCQWSRLESNPGPALMDVTCSAMWHLSLSHDPCVWCSNQSKKDQFKPVTLSSWSRCCPGWWGHRRPAALCTSPAPPQSSSCNREQSQPQTRTQEHLQHLSSVTVTETPFCSWTGNQNKGSADQICGKVSWNMLGPAEFIKAHSCPNISSFRSTVESMKEAF